MGSKYLVFRNSSFPPLNGYSICWLCLTFWTNEFLGSYSNYKFIISFSIFSRMGLWRILCSQSFIEEVLSLSFSTPIFPFHSSKRFLWFHSNSLSIFSSNSFRGLFSLIFLSFFYFFSLDRCSIPSREVSILCSYLDITLLFFFFFFLKKKKKKKKKKKS